VDDDNKEKRRIKRRNYIQRDLRDLRGPFSPKMISPKKEAYKREKTKKDFNIDNEDE
jgi:hypothetical protein